tara:strand:- start:221 stop:697 length:477 start_codon:yes stop_codon:yes gene_type:complete
MTFTKKLQSLNLPEDSLVTLTYEDGTDVFHYNESEIDTAISETTVISEFVSLISNSRLKASHRWCGNVLEHLRDNHYLEDYERGSYEFEEYLADTITENFYDVDLIEYSTEKYDHKRGFTTLTAEVQIPMAILLKEKPFLAGWKLSVETENGTLTFDT